jgi:hypothetical protein
MGWLPNRLPAAVAWLDNDVPACRALAVAWLERGATADRSGIRHARHGSPHERERKGPVDGGSDDRCDTRSHVVSELVKEVWLMPET